MMPPPDVDRGRFEQMRCPGVRPTPHGKRLCHRPLGWAPKAHPVELRALDSALEASGEGKLLWCTACLRWIEASPAAGVLRAG